jgi:hypothetical protein
MRSAIVVSWVLVLSACQPQSTSGQCDVGCACYTTPETCPVGCYAIYERSKIVRGPDASFVMYFYCSSIPPVDGGQSDASAENETNASD